jgi:hypothetical protein
MAPTLRSSALAFLFVLALTPSRASAARVLVVSDAGADLGVVDVLVADGHQVTTVTNDFATGNATLAGDLFGYDLVVWSATGNGYGDAHSDGIVFANLASFVSAGGRVFVTGYDTVASPTDPLLIELLGATGSTDVPPAPGPVAMIETSLTTGVVDIRGVVPSPLSGDRDTLTGLRGDTLEIVATAGGGAGAQWTLRRLGAGEIAYVSNGDAGGSTLSWSTTSSDGTGVYNAALRNFAAACNGHSTIAHVASHGSPRRAHTMYLLDAATPAVLVGSDRAWIPPGVAIPLAICGPACHPIRETRECTTPECPGQGTLLIASERIADVPDFPRDRVGWNRERVLLMADAELSAVGWAFGAHPEPPPSPPRPAYFLRPRDERLGWELHVEGGGGVLTTASVGVATLSASVGLRFQPDIDEPLDVMYGNVHGADLRVTVVPGITGQRADDLAVLVGISPAFAFAFANDRIRIPPAFAFLIPELGLAVSTTRPVTYYFSWHLEAAVLLEEHVGLDVRADLTLIDEWVPGDDVEVMLSLGAGVFFR